MYMYAGLWSDTGIIDKGGYRVLPDFAVFSKKKENQTKTKTKH